MRVSPLVVFLVISIAMMVVVTYLALSSAQQTNQNRIIIEPDGPAKFAYKPSSLTVHVGEKVTWVNYAFFPMTVTSDNATDPFDSGGIEYGSSFEHTFNIVGTFHYHGSTPHLIGIITVVP